MSKIFMRSTLTKGVKKKKDDKKRRRNIIKNFRVTPEECQLIEDRIAISGLSKSDFFIQSCLYQKIYTTGNVKTFDEIKKRMELIDEHLCSIQRTDELDLEILESLRTILEMLDSIYGNGGEDDEECSDILRTLPDAP